MSCRLYLALATGPLSHLSLRLLHWLGNVAAIWVLLSAAAVLSLLAVGAWHRLSARLKVAMIEAAGPLPPQFHDRRHRQRGRFRLRMTRRQLSPQEGATLESLRHAIDYLIQSYGLKSFANRPWVAAPAQVNAVEILLQKRAEMLAEHPPMPSLASLLRRRFAYLKLAKHKEKCCRG
jgi:hypothetical protein